MVELPIGKSNSGGQIVAFVYIPWVVLPKAIIPIAGIIPQFANLQESAVFGLERKLNTLFMFSIHGIHKCSAYQVPFSNGRQMYIF